MKQLVSVLALSLLVFGANAANDRATVSGKMIMSAPRYTASINQLNNAGTVAVAVKTEETDTATKKDMREAERNACINNNIGVGNTFVWASRYSDTSNYTSMVEDVENPENNVCFVRVELKSDNESRVNVSDVAPKYFMWGEAIECGSWVNEKEMEKRILDAKKGARIGGIVASTVGSAGLGVGTMELIGNTSIKGWKGQKDLEGVELYRSQLLVYQKNNPTEYNNIVANLKTIKEAHDSGETVERYEELYEPLINEFVK